MSSNEAPKIILYTNHACPWAHRAHIALRELGLQYEEQIIDLDTPRTAEYLAINPRGLVPTISYNGEIIAESGIVAQFLADAHPSHLEKSTSEEGGALQRARINFFVDAYISKVNPHFFGILFKSGEEKAQAEEAFVGAIVKEIEPLLKDAAPFFGGSSKLTLAEVQTGSFLLRVLTFPKNDVLPPSLLTTLEKKTPNFWKWANAVIVEESVNFIYDEKKIAEKTAARIAKAAAAAKI